MANYLASLAIANLHTKFPIIPLFADIRDHFQMRNMVDFIAMCIANNYFPHETDYRHLGLELPELPMSLHHVMHQYCDTVFHFERIDFDLL